MIKKITFILFCAFFAASCVKESPAAPEPADGEGRQVSEFSVPIERALEEMYAVMGSAYGETRAGGAAIKSIETVDGRRLFAGTRAGIDTLDIADLLYIVNFDDDEGFAILAADSRIEPVLSVTERGSLTANDFYQNTARELTLEDLYCEEDDDYYLGGADAPQFVAGIITDFVDRTIFEEWPPRPPGYTDPIPPSDFERDYITYEYGPWEGRGGAVRA